MRKDGGDARADRVAFDEGGMTGANAGHVGDGIPLSRGQHTGFDPEFPRPPPRANGLREQGQRHEQAAANCAWHTSASQV